ncbi:MAG: hypothetical protein U0872_13120 [Planctomycetaceae bacterium]
MSRSLVTLSFTISGVLFWAGPAANAQPISIHNPYRSYSLTGLNYGSMQWEQAHPRRSAATTSSPSPGHQPPVYYQSPDHRSRRIWRRCR